MRLSREPRTLLVGLSHPDDEVGCAGTIAAHVGRGDRVVLVFLTRGAMTEAMGPLPGAEVARLRESDARSVGRILGCEVRFLDFEDTWVQATPQAAHDVGRLVAEVQPDAVLTWGDAWRRGPRHPDHQATGKIFRDAITIARMARAVAPQPPHRKPAPVFTLRGDHSALPVAAVDVSAHLDSARAVGAFYRGRVGWPQEAWLEERLSSAGARWQVAAAEEFDAWETEPGLRLTLV